MGRVCDILEPTRTIGDRDVKSNPGGKGVIATPEVCTCGHITSRVSMSFVQLPHKAHRDRISIALLFLGSTRWSRYSVFRGS